MPVITISRQLGSMGSDIARLLSKKIGCKFLDKDTLDLKFGEYGIPIESVEKYDEKKPGFWDLFKSDRYRYLHFMKGIVFDFARDGDGIILGRGGQAILGDVPGVLNVRIVAPLDIRIRRLMESFEMDERQVQKMIINSDNERAGFHKFFFDCNWEENSLYDLVLNSGTLSCTDIVGLVESAANSLERGGNKSERETRLTDLCLEQDIKTILVFKEKVGVQFLEVLAHRGIVTLRGIVASEADVDWCARLARNVPHVREIKNELYYKPVTSTYGLHY